MGERSVKSSNGREGFRWYRADKRVGEDHRDQNDVSDVIIVREVITCQEI